MSMSRYPEYKDSGVEWLGQVPAHWKLTHSGLITKYVKGMPSTELYFEPGPGRIPFLRTGDYWNSNPQPVYVRDEPQLIKKELGEAVVCFDGFNTVLDQGTIGLFSRKLAGALDGMLWLLYTKNEHVATRKFLEYCHGSAHARSHVVADARGAIAKHAGHAVASIPVLLPPLSEQQAITAFLDRETAKIDALVAEANTAIDLLKERRSALISAAVTGKIDVRGTSTLEAAA